MFEFSPSVSISQVFTGIRKVQCVFLIVSIQMVQELTAKLFYQRLNTNEKFLRSYEQIHVAFDCQKCIASVRLDESSDIAYLTRLAKEGPGLYAKLASRNGRLHGYIETIREFN